ncbi:hypothetical protein SISNIDRAFT_487408 [Sistotremastrum niveocremeum HHB9708]|uniref:Uncharacterized protein n=2 Tax=Sistotremastraceae TaxID=3402574 RepID=A0A164SFD4_9AGAM|nr:hypothetical protein SISNIDRAFT_487408 [Sistotremastrum niveocremeum HHB9708]KZT34851.1 hypothetical protein SISSUDRAFT_1064983 [Sistotremastrum suecicum HHB10207 ss-3]
MSQTTESKFAVLRGAGLSPSKRLTWHWDGVLGGVATGKEDGLGGGQFKPASATVRPTGVQNKGTFTLVIAETSKDESKDSLGNPSTADLTLTFEGSTTSSTYHFEGTSDNVAGTWKGELTSDFLPPQA